MDMCKFAIKRFGLVLVAVIFLSGCLSDEKDLSDSKINQDRIETPQKAEKDEKAFFWEKQPSDANDPVYTSNKRSDKKIVAGAQLLIPVYLRQFESSAWQKLDDLDLDLFSLRSSCQAQGKAELEYKFSGEEQKIEVLYTPSQKCKSDEITASYKDAQSTYVISRIEAGSTGGNELHQSNFEVSFSGPSDTSPTIQWDQTQRVEVELKEDGVRYMGNAQIQLTSSCSESGLAEFSPADSAITTGRLIGFYTAAEGCNNDTLIARALVDAELVDTQQISLNFSTPMRPTLAVNLIGLNTSETQDLLADWPIHYQGFFQVNFSPMPSNGETVTFHFGSDCSLQETAELTATELESFSGQVEVGYRPSFNCARDTLVVRAEVEGEQVASQSLNINTVAAEAYSLSFDGFTPVVAEGYVPRLRRKDINTNGLLVENRTLTFTLRDVSGSPVGAGKTVRFEFQADDGLGLGDLSDSQKPRFSSEAAATKEVVSNSQGQVRVSLEGGTYALAFNIKASLLDEEGDELNPGVFALSPSIFVTSGLASLERFNLFKSHFEEDSVPYSSREYDFRALIGDEHGHPLPDGTPVSFVDRSNGVGSVIEPSCLLGESGPGQCRVNWYGATSNFPIRVEATTSGTDGPETRSGTWNPAND